MALAVLLAWRFPHVGAEGGAMHPELVTQGGIALIFFLHGLLLSPTVLKEGAFRWRLHALVQATTFVLFPLLGLLYLTVSDGVVASVLALGFFYLCALPSTVSSSVAMTAAARGDVAVAVFNATLSSLLGIVLTPLWMGWVMKQGGAAPDLGAVVLDLVQVLLLPLLAGQALRPWLGAWAQRHRRWVSKVDRLTILLLVYTSFCESFAVGVWSGLAPMTLLLVGGSVALLLLVVLAGTIRLCRALNIAPAQRAAVVFCGSKKSLATGVPMAQVMFAGQAGLGMILLPIMLYHALQLLVCAWLASRWAKQAD